MLRIVVDTHCQALSPPRAGLPYDPTLGYAAARPDACPAFFHSGRLQRRQQTCRAGPRRAGRGRPVIPAMSNNER